MLKDKCLKKRLGSLHNQSKKVNSTSAIYNLFHQYLYIYIYICVCVCLFYDCLFVIYQISMVVM
jgi:hypothetical protein